MLVESYKKVMSTTAKKTSPKKSHTKGTSKKNKLGVKNLLVNNINARKKNGTSRSKKKSTISKKNYEDMENNWGSNK